MFRLNHFAASNAWQTSHTDAAITTLAAKSAVGSVALEADAVPEPERPISNAAPKAVPRTAVDCQSAVTWRLMLSHIALYIVPRKSYLAFIFASVVSGTRFPRIIMRQLRWKRLSAMRPLRALNSPT